MAFDFLLDALDKLPAMRALAEQLPTPGARLAVGGLPGSSPAALVAALARRFPQRVFVVLAPTPVDAERWLADAATLVGRVAALYPQREGLGAEEPHLEIAGERVETVAALLSGAVRVLVTTARASAERSGVPAALERHPIGRRTETRQDLRPRRAQCGRSAARRDGIRARIDGD